MLEFGTNALNTDLVSRKFKIGCAATAANQSLRTTSSRRQAVLRVLLSSYRCRKVIKVDFSGAQTYYFWEQRNQLTMDDDPDFLYDEDKL